MPIPFRFVHAADLHLGSAFKDLHRTNPEVAAFLRESTYRAFDGIIDLALHHRVDFVLFAGDIYNQNENNLQPQLRFRDGLNRLHQAGIASCVVHGNHDPLDGKHANLAWPESCHRFPDKPSPPRVMRRGATELAAVCGISYGRRDVSEKLAARYKHEHPHLFTIGLLHTNCGGDGAHANYAPSTLDELKSYAFDYWALGHLHAPRILAPVSPCVVYAGSPQGLNPKEIGPHGCYLVTVDEDGVPVPRFEPTCEVVWVGETIDASNWKTGDDAVGELEAGLRRLETGHEGRSVLARLDIAGRTPLHPWLKEENVRRDLLERLRGLYGTKPFVWIDDLTVSTQPEIDYQSRRAEQDVLGEVLRQADLATVSPEVLREARTLLAPFLEKREVSRLLAEASDEQLAAWIGRAAMLAVDRLVAEEAAA